MDEKTYTPDQQRSNNVFEENDVEVNSDTAEENPNHEQCASWGLSNMQLLAVAFVTFFLFTIAELIFSFVAQSHSMMGDALAMLVDSITYLLNCGAEYYKAKLFEDSKNIELTEADKLQQRKRILQLEIVPPLVSVAALSAITIMITQQAAATLATDLRDTAAGQQNNNQPNVAIMFGFSFTNLIIDILNVSCFARSKIAKTLKSINGVEIETPKAIFCINLNMCAAFTHISADTLRSIAVVIASITALLDPNVNKVMADSGSALVISGIIFVTLIPLIRELYRSVVELRSSYLEERRELGQHQEEIMERGLKHYESTESIRENQ